MKYFKISETRPSIVCLFAVIFGLIPLEINVSDVIGPIEAQSVSIRYLESFFNIFSKLVTVEELVNVIRSILFDFSISINSFFEELFIFGTTVS